MPQQPHISALAPACPPPPSQAIKMRRIRRRVQYLFALVGGLALLALLRLGMLALPEVEPVAAAPAPGPLADSMTGTLTVQHSASTTHRMRVFGNGRITDRYLTDTGRNQVDQDGENPDATTIAVLFDQHALGVLDVGAKNDFYTTTLITLSDPSFVPGYSEDSYVLYASRRLSYTILQRTVTTDTVYGDWLAMDLKIRNEGELPLTGGKLLFMVDIDAATADVGDEGGYEDEEGGEQGPPYLVYQTDEYEGIAYAMGMSLLNARWAGFGVDGKYYPSTDAEKIQEMLAPTNAVRDDNNDVSWIVANIPTLLTGQEARLIFGLCARTADIETRAAIRVANCLDSIVLPNGSPGPVLKLTKGGPDPAKVGDNIFYPISVSHAPSSGGVPVHDVTIIDHKADRIDFIGGDNGNHKLEVGETWQYYATHRVKPTDDDPLCNEARVEAKDPDNRPIAASDGHCLDVEFEPALRLSQSGPGEANEGDTVTFTFGVTNDSGSGDGSRISGVVLTGSPVQVKGCDGVSGPEPYALEGGQTLVCRGDYTIPDGSACTTIQNRVTVEGLDRDGDGMAGTHVHDLKVKCVSPPRLTFLPIVLKRWPLCASPAHIAPPWDGWPIRDDSRVRAGPEGDAYRMATRVVGMYASMPSESDFNYCEIWASARWASAGTSGQAYGIVFGLASSDNRGYAYEINADRGEYRLLLKQSTGGPRIPLTNNGANDGWIHSDEILSGTAKNNFGVRWYGSQISLGVNGRWLDTVLNDTINAGQVGLMVEAYVNDPSFGTRNADVYFDSYSHTRCLLPGSTGFEAPSPPESSSVRELTW